MAEIGHNSSSPAQGPSPNRSDRATTFLGRLTQAVRGRNWLAFVFELGIIVLGVAIGLQADNWNEIRTAENDARALIENLRSEFVSNRVSLETTRTSLDEIMGASRELLALFGRQDIGMSESELDNLIELTFFWPIWMPSNSVSQELMSSGYLSVLDDDGVKPLLFEWERNMRQVEEWNRRMERSSQDLIDYVKDHGSLRNTNHNRVAIERSALDVRNRPLLFDPTFENYVDEKLMMAQFLASQYRRADEIVDQIIGASERHRGGPDGGSE
jgi:hypothetical protein